MELPGICVLVGENIEAAIRILRQKCERSRLKEDIQRHKFFLTRLQRRKEKDRKALQKRLKRRRVYESRSPVRGSVHSRGDIHCT